MHKNNAIVEDLVPMFFIKAYQNIQGTNLDTYLSRIRRLREKPVTVIDNIIFMVI